MVRVAVGENDRADLVRLNPFGSKQGKEFSRGRPHAIHSYPRIYQHPLTSGVDEETNIGKIDFLRVLTALAQQGVRTAPWPGSSETFQWGNAERHP